MLHEMQTFRGEQISRHLALQNQPITINEVVYYNIARDGVYFRVLLLDLNGLRGTQGNLP
jgi:hypothetical protein